MKLTVFLFLIASLILISSPDSRAAGLRCHGSLVAIGDTKSQVIDKCGQPSHIETWQEERLTDKGYFHRHRRHRSKSDHYTPYATKIIINVEEWTYNFGSTKFIRYLTFEKGRLEDIRVGEKGY